MFAEGAVRVLVATGDLNTVRGKLKPLEIERVHTRLTNTINLWHNLIKPVELTRLFVELYFEKGPTIFFFSH